MSLAATLAATLAQLASEAKRRHPDIKEAADRQAALLKVYKGRAESDIIDALRHSKDTLKPYALACQSNQGKLIALGVDGIHQLTLRKAFDKHLVSVATHALKAASPYSDVQLRVLQCMTALYSGYANVHGEALQDLLEVGLGLSYSAALSHVFHGISSSESVAPIASASVRQLISSVFDKLWVEPTQQRSIHPDWDDIDQDSQLKDAQNILSDLLCLCNVDAKERQHIQWAILPTDDISLETVLEMIELILSSHASLIIHVLLSNVHVC